MKTSEDIKKDFPIFDTEMEFAYLDNGATTHKPRMVIDAISQYYRTDNANPHRGVYRLSMMASYILSRARRTVASFIGCEEEESIVFTKNSTESLNLLAYSYGLNNVKEGDNIVVSILEHHSNLVPWQMVAKKCGATLRYMYLDDTLSIPDKELDKIDERTRVVCITSGSNVLGTLTDVKKITKKAHSVGAVVVCDITQSVAHFPFDVKATDVDFAVFSGHKIYGPMGAGVLYGKKNLLDTMPPFLYGGDMIEFVSEIDASFASLPNKFEAGTINLASVVGLESAIEYIRNIGYDEIRRLEDEVLKYALQEMKKLNFVDLYIPAGQKLPIISFNVRGVHSHDVSSLLDQKSVFIRSGHHCAQPLIEYLGVDSTCRASLAIYNTKEDIDRLVEALKYVQSTFSKYLKKDKK